MAHQFPPTTGFNAGYPPLPLYPPFPQSSSQSYANGQLGFHQPVISQPGSQIPTPQPTNGRYDAISQAASQPAPPPFLANFTPDILRHFPPPPPPPMNFPMVVPGTPIPFANFQQTSGSTPNLHAHAQPQSYHSETIPSGAHSDTQNPARVANNFSQNQGAVQRNTSLPAQYNHPVDQIIDRDGHQANIVHRNEQHSQGSQDFTTQLDKNSQHKSSALNVTNHHSLSNISTPYIHRGSPKITKNLQGMEVPALVALYTNPETATQLREHAKAAVLSLVPLKITYKDILEEGIDASVLQHLFNELGLSWQQTARTADTQSTNSSFTIDHAIPNNARKQKSEDVSTHHEESPTEAVVDSGNATSGQTTIVQPTPAAKAIERKDRIAQLLAAKSAKSGAQSFTSQSHSPISVPGSLSSQPAPSGKATPTQGVSDTQIAAAARTGVRPSQGVATGESTPKVAFSDALANESGLAGLPALVTKDQPSAQLVRAARNHLAALPTPIRQSVVREAISSTIPGLFMAADEEDNRENIAISASVPEAYEAYGTAQITTADAHSTSNQPQSGQKRRAADSIDSRTPKRAVSSDGEIDEDESADTDASDGEIVDDDQADVIERTATTASAPERQSNERNVLSLTRVAGPNGLESATNSGPTTPHKSSGIPTIKQQTNAVPSSGDRTSTGSGLLSRSSTEDFAEKAARLKADIIMRQRALRQKQLTDGLPILDDEVNRVKQQIEQYRSKLSETRLNIEKFQEQIDTARAVEVQLLEDISRLEQQLRAGITGQKELSKELTAINQQVTGATNANTMTSSPLARQGQQSISSPTIHSKPSTTTIELDLEKQANEDSTTGPSGSEPELELAVQSRQESIHGDGDMSAVQSDPELSNVTRVKFPSDSAQYREVLINDAGMEDDVPETSNVNGSHAAHHSESMEESRSNDDESMRQSDDESDDTHMSVDETSDGSASMSDSGSEDYEPPEPKGRQGTSSARPEDSDEYEPEDDMQISAQEDGSELPNDDAPLASTHNANTINHTDPLEANTTPIVQAEVQQPQTELPKIVSQVPHSTNAKADDVEQGLQLSAANTLIKPQTVSNDIVMQDGDALSGESSRSDVKYTPYQSPLSSFKSYRFHPSFTEQVKTGYRSLTYSNKIDWKQPLCPAELAGEVCTDPTCEEQHFGSMVLPDDKILVQMSSANDIKDKALRDQYLIGLKQVIAQLRQEGVKEFPLVAEALSKYRREWAASQMDT